MQAGKLKHRITIQQPTVAKDSVGQEIVTWTDFKTVWAAIEPAVGNVYYTAKQLDAEVSGRIKLRYLTGLEPTMRIKYGDRYFSIVSILYPQESRKEVHIMYKEGLD